jgi:Family of unknown function (DUF6925)
MSGAVAPPDWLAEQLVDAETAWSVGGFGAIAEFMRDDGEATDLRCGGDVISAVTARGGLRIGAHQGMRRVASETLTTQSWSQRVSLCLPHANCAMDQRAILTELGPDTDALRAVDRSSVLFDLGLGLLQVNACIRTSDADVVGALRACSGRSLSDPGNPATRIILAENPHRVFISRVGRVEVYQAIPPSDGKSPEGPHTHVLPRLLRHKRTHAATEFVPSGWIPCGHLYPPHPVRDGMGRRHSFRNDRHVSFQKTLARFGDPELLSIKHKVFDAVASGCPPSALPRIDDRFGRAALRIALRQIEVSGDRPSAIDAWLAEYDRGDIREADEERHGGA